MLDKQSLKLLIYLAHICEDGSFKIVETAEMTKAVSKKAELATIKPTLKFLQDHEMIDVKYSDESKYSLSVLPKGRVYVETQGLKSVDVTLGRRMIIFAIAGSFIAAFLGALLANIIFKLAG